MLLLNNACRSLSSCRCSTWPSFFNAGSWLRNSTRRCSLGCWSQCEGRDRIRWSWAWLRSPGCRIQISIRRSAIPQGWGLGSCPRRLDSRTSFCRTGYASSITVLLTCLRIGNCWLCCTWIPWRDTPRFSNTSYGRWLSSPTSGRDRIFYKDGWRWAWSTPWWWLQLAGSWTEEGFWQLGPSCVMRLSSPALSFYR